MRTLYILGLVLLLARGFSQSAIKDSVNSPLQPVQAAMQAQEDAWNKGNIEGFMAYYWNNEGLEFIGSKGITRGWKNTLENYKKSYPDQEAMGQLTFHIERAEWLSPECIFVVGSWKLKKKDKDVGGYYTLLWRKLEGKWVIVVDHTS